MSQQQKSPPPVLSIVSPVYHAYEIVDELVKRIRAACRPITLDFEIILVEDGSTDDSWGAIVRNAAQFPEVQGFRLSRNFGQHNAIRAGIEQSRGEYVVIMDCDLQDDPNYIPSLFSRIKEGFDIVYTVKRQREHPKSKNIISFAFHRVFNVLSSTSKIDPQRSGYVMVSRRAASCFSKFTESNKAYLTILQWLDLPSTTIEVDHKARFQGKSSYTLQKLFRQAINGIVANSDKLLYATLLSGVSLIAASFLTAGWLIVLYFLHGAQPGWTSMIVALLLCTGIILSFLGTLAIYIAKILEQVYQRPLYLISEKVSGGTLESTCVVNGSSCLRSFE